MVKAVSERVIFAKNRVKCDIGRVAGEESFPELFCVCFNESAKGEHVIDGK